MRKNPHVRICGGLGSATTLVYPTASNAMTIPMATGPSLLAPTELVPTPSLVVLIGAERVTADAALLHESELAHTDPDPQFFHRPMRYDIGLPSPVI